jgi:hypothetical protein
VAQPGVRDPALCPPLIQAPRHHEQATISRRPSTGAVNIPHRSRTGAWRAHSGSPGVGGDRVRPVIADLPRGRCTLVAKGRPLMPRATCQVICGSGVGAGALQGERLEGVQIAFRGLWGGGVGVAPPGGSGVFECFAELLDRAIVLIGGQGVAPGEDEGHWPLEHAERSDGGVVGEALRFGKADRT